MAMYWIKAMHMPEAKKFAHLGLIASLLGGAACTTSQDRVLTQFHTEAGSVLNRGEFGYADNNNLLVMTGEREYTFNLAKRFAEESPSMVTFAFNSASLDADAQALLRMQADWIKQFPEIHFRVYGHTDAVGSDRYNKALGLRRAQAVVSYLARLGISLSRLEAVVSFGETQPLVVTQGRERRNRRTVTEVSGFVKRHPTVLDGKYAQIIYRDYVASAQSETVLSQVTAVP